MNLLHEMSNVHKNRYMTLHQMNNVHQKKHELTSGEQCSPKKCLNFPGMSNVHKKYMTFHEMNNDQQNRK
jgi:hypothetical protein